MRKIIACIEELRLKLDRHNKGDLKEYPTRTIFIDTMLYSLGWDVRDPDDVQLEFPTVDGKSVDYALKLNNRPVAFIEAKCLNDPLTDVKAITQVVGYAANAGVEWCILTNGINYRVYRSTEKAEAPDKLLFEVSIDPEENDGKSTQQVAEQLNRFSRESMANGVLNAIGNKIFTVGKIRKALDKIFLDPPAPFIKEVRKKLGDSTIKPAQIKDLLQILWAPAGGSISRHSVGSNDPKIVSPKCIRRRSKKLLGDYGEGHHLNGKPQEVVELYRNLDRYCLDIDPQNIVKKHLKHYVSYAKDDHIFCSVHITKSGIRIWIRGNYSDLKNPPEFIRDVSKIGHWGLGNVEIDVDSLNKLQAAKKFIEESLYIRK
jgi:predicted transport protein